jgi:hypothetical protein
MAMWNKAMALLCIAGAVLLLYTDKGGAGWLLFLAVLFY